jgi:transposase
MASQYVVEHLNHLGIVAEVCREVGIASWLDSLDPTSRQRISVGTATVALILNGLGFSNRQLYLVPQFFADKPVEHLLGPGIRAEDLNDDCLGRTLDWLHAHDVTTLFAGIAQRARQAFGFTVERWHADTTSFHVHGQYDQEPNAPAVIQVTYGYSRDHRADLKQWMLAIITSGEGVPHFMRPLDGQASDKQSLLAVITQLVAQLRASGEPIGVHVADSGLYSVENMQLLHQTGVQWVSRVPETLVDAQIAVRTTPANWQQNEEGTCQWWGQIVRLPQGSERWIIVRSREGEARARATMQRQAARDLATWTQRWQQIAKRSFACEPDAQTAVTQLRLRLPAWVQVQMRLEALPTYAAKGRPRKGLPPASHIWKVHATVTIDADALEFEALRRAAYIIGTNLLDASTWPEERIIALYQEQAQVEKGFAFLKDPLFLASSVFVKKPERIMAIAFIMVLCLLVYKLAEWRVRQRLASTGHTIPDQVRKPTQRPTMRWIFQCFEGIDLLHRLVPDGSRHTQILRLSELHRLVLQLLGPAYEHAYLLTA